jgi:hypothetical protein
MAIIQSKMNTDGAKKEGIYFWLGHLSRRLSDLKYPEILGGLKGSRNQTARR